ncbi:alpha/beta-hydrolase [Coprinopsis marcescibilis]|uniref:Alpha/beta-hydrolase n=1 Tax=Coprinopsis marcescibilis TaxID=230819 RepID=A0A5C3KLG1_COPMA|nr:alpha/beta-hydrolase [Coprinopsis marcescibilis]
MFSTVKLHLIKGLSALIILSGLVVAQSSSLARDYGPDCLEGFTYSGRVQGKNITIAGVPTYSARPSKNSGTKKVIMFFPDVFGPFYVNNELLQDQFASQGYHVFGIDYFFGDPIQIAQTRPNFNQTEWILKSVQQAAESVPRWIEGVRQLHGANSKYNAVGYCFGAPYAMDIGSTDKVVATAFAHPSALNEEHFRRLTKADTAFPVESVRRAHDILSANNASYHLQVFSGVTHGFAIRSDPENSNAVWAKEESAKSVIEWFNRFSK